MRRRDQFAVEALGPDIHTVTVVDVAHRRNAYRPGR